MKSAKSKWSDESKSSLKSLHNELLINNRDWHKNKSDPDKRAAELLISALSQLLNEGDKKYVIELIQQASKWLKNEVKDPGCPGH